MDSRYNYISANTVPASFYLLSDIVCSPLLCYNAEVNVNLCSFAAANQVIGVFLPDDTLMVNNLLLGPYYEQLCAATGTVQTDQDSSGTSYYTNYLNTFDNYYPLDSCGVYFSYQAVTGYNVVISNQGGTLYYNTGVSSGVCGLPPTPASITTATPSVVSCDPNQGEPGSCCPTVPGSVTIAAGVAAIPSGAFKGCATLTSIDIPDTVTSLGTHIFYGCSALTSVTIGGGITALPDSTFQSCTSLTSVIIPDTVMSLGIQVFEYCISLTSVKLPATITVLPDYTFADCRSLSTITIPNSVTSIDTQVFAGCASLTSLTIPNTVASLGLYMLAGCTDLRTLTIPNVLADRIRDSGALVGSNFQSVMLKFITCKYYTGDILVTYILAGTATPACSESVSPTTPPVPTFGPTPTLST